MITRTATIADLPTILELEDESPSPWSSLSIESEITSEFSVVTCLELDGSMLGWVACRVVAGEAEILKIAIFAKHRQQGYGHFFLGHIVEKLHMEGVVKIFLEVRSQNLPAISLYLKNGFEKVGRRKNYYDKPQDDALILEKSLL